MKRTVMACGIIVALLVGAGLFPGGMAAPAPVPRQADKWEYAELHAYYFAGGLDGNRRNIPVKATLRWITAEATVEGSAVNPQHRTRKPDGGSVSTLPSVAAAAWEDISKKLKAPPGNKDDTEQTRRLKLLNHLGEQGWELAACQPSDPSAQLALDELGSPTVWVFKRKLK